MTRFDEVLAVLEGPGGHADCPSSECPAKRLADAIYKALGEGGAPND